jgi:hypothetical protein
MRWPWSFVNERETIRDIHKRKGRGELRTRVAAANFSGVNIRDIYYPYVRWSRETLNKTQEW